MKNRVSLFIFWLLVLALTYPGRAVAQEAAPPSTRYQDPLLTEVQWWAPPHEPVAPRQTEIPAWFMPWSLVVYQSLQNHKDWNIYLLNPQGHHIQLTNEPSHEIHPRLNRGATQVVFASNRTGHFDLLRKHVLGMPMTA